MTATATRKRRAPKPLTCAVVTRPVCPCELLPHGAAGLVAINDTEYALSYHAELPPAGEPKVYGYRVTKLADPASSYDLPADLGSCECLGQLRFGYCRHQTALRQLRRDGAI